MKRACTNWCFKTLLTGAACLVGVATSKSFATVSTSLAISNFSFETPVQSPSGYVYDPSNAGWTFSAPTFNGGGSGICGATFLGDGTFGGSTAPDGSQYAFLQRVGSASQTVAFPSSGSYELSFYLAGRPTGGTHIYPDDGNEQVLVSVGGNQIFQASTTTGQAFQFYTVDFTASAGPQLLQFAGNVLPQDNTAYLDDVKIVSVPEPAACSAMALMSGALLARRRRR